MNDNLPKDPFMLLSMINMYLRNQYSDLDDLCASLDIDKSELENILNSVEYFYDPAARQFRYKS